MRKIMIKKIPHLLDEEISHLVNESKGEGFRFIERLVDEFENGKNTFKNPGEALFGVLNEMDELVAIGGINQDSFSNDPRIGRLRRFYVSKKYRRMGIGTKLLNTIKEYAASHFDHMVLHTDTVQADEFYVSYGFLRISSFPNTTHILDLIKK